MLNYSELMQLIENRLGKTENGQKITGPDVRAVVEAILDGLTDDGQKLPPYAAANATNGILPVLGETGYEDSSLSEMEGLGGKVLSTGSAWLWGNNCFKKSAIVSFEGTGRYETTIILPRGNYGLATVEVRMVGWGSSRGVLRLQYGIDTANATADYVTVMEAEGALPSEIYLSDTEYSTSEIGIVAYQKAANTNRQYLLEVSVVGSVDFLEALFEKTALTSAVVLTTRNAASVRAVPMPEVSVDMIDVQMSIAKDESGLKLVGDVTTPNINQMYGTNASGTKGWFDVPTQKRILAKVYNGTIYVSSVGSNELIVLNTDGVTLADGNVLEATLIGELLQNSGAAASYTFSIDVTHSGGTSTLTFAAESFATNGSGYIVQYKVWITKRGTGLYVLGSWQASRSSGGTFESGSVANLIANQLTVSQVKIKGVMSVNSSAMSMTPHVGWLTLI